MPTLTTSMRTLADFSAASTAVRMDWTVCSMLATTPRVTPMDALRPYPMTSSLPWAFFWPTMQAILVVPMSSPTTMSWGDWFWFMGVGMGSFAGHELSVVAEVQGAVLAQVSTVEQGAVEGLEVY